MSGLHPRQFPATCVVPKPVEPVTLVSITDLATKPAPAARLLEAAPA